MDNPVGRGMTKTSTTGNSNKTGIRKAPHRLNHRGFTFIEITVVIFLIGLIIGLAMPRVRDAFLTDDLRRTCRKMIGLMKELRNEAIRENKAYFMHFDLDGNRFWVDSTSMSEEEQARAREQASSLPEDVRVVDVWFRGKGKTVGGETSIRFSNKGYVPQSAIHLSSEDGRSFTLELSPFLGRVKVLESYVEYES
jgi:prepilin-type N-terminal cleavage/methylation domain-containing protein